jgi:hypothetical protein
VKGGDRIWWDYRDWTSAMSVPAVVGSWPQPFASANGGPIAIDCAGSAAPCATARARLERAGMRARIVNSMKPANGPRIIVGPWASVRTDAAAHELLSGPSASGVFASFGGGKLRLLRADGTVGQNAPAGTGLVAAVRRGDDPPTWVVTSTRPAGVERAARRLDSTDLANHYAVAAFADAAVPLPLSPGGAK